MALLFLFLDGVGLGVDDPLVNPFAHGAMPNLVKLLGGNRLLAKTAPFDGERASLRALDATLGVDGVPQSATGQAVLLTGVNVPAALGYHYGPKPNPPVADFLRNGNLFSRLQQSRYRVTFLNAYPPHYFSVIQSGHRMHSAVPLAVTSAGVPLKTIADLYAGQALSADFTGQAWRDRLGYPDILELTPFQAGQCMARLSAAVDFAFFEFWLSDYAGHEQNMVAACALLMVLDGVIGGLLETWDDTAGLILLTSDHGNLEDLTTRRHTLNRVPALVIGGEQARWQFVAGLHDLTSVAPAIVTAVWQFQ